MAAADKPLEKVDAKLFERLFSKAEQVNIKPCPERNVLYVLCADSSRALVGHFTLPFARVNIKQSQSQSSSLLAHLRGSGDQMMYLSVARWAQFYGRATAHSRRGFELFVTADFEEQMLYLECGHPRTGEYALYRMHNETPNSRSYVDPLPPLRGPCARLAPADLDTVRRMLKVLDDGDGVELRFSRDGKTLCARTLRSDGGGDAIRLRLVRIPLSLGPVVTCGEEEDATTTLRAAVGASFLRAAMAACSWIRDKAEEVVVEWRLHPCDDGGGSGDCVFVVRATTTGSKLECTIAVVPLNRDGNDDDADMDKVYSEAVQMCM